MYLIDKNLMPTAAPKTLTPDVAGLIAWLEQQPSEGVYCYESTGHCLLAQFFSALHGESVSSIGATKYSLSGDQFSLWDERRDVPPELDNIAGRRPRTFGAALARARAIQ
jgi:hypothetical protein